MTKLLDEIHPGEILQEEFLTPMGISGRRLAADLDVPPSRVSEILHGTRPITADTAVRLGVYFKMNPRFWMNLQTTRAMQLRFSRDFIRTILSYRLWCANYGWRARVGLPRRAGTRTSFISCWRRCCSSTEAWCLR